MCRAVCVLVIVELILAGDTEAFRNRMEHKTRNYTAAVPLGPRHRHARNIEQSRIEAFTDPEQGINDRNDPALYISFEDAARDKRYMDMEYENLCETVTETVELRSEEYEFIPPMYHEVYCKYYSVLTEDERKTVHPSRQKCAYPAFHCVQRSRTLFALRRRWDSACWEPYTKQIHSGCDCMWPTEHLGAIAEHY